MTGAKWYSPQLDRALVTALYHAAKARRVPMTRLASSLVREGLMRMNESVHCESSVVREEPPAFDPSGRKP